MLNLPTVTHAIVVRIRIVDIGTVLGFLEFVGQTITIGVEACFDEHGLSPDVFLNGALVSTDFFTGLEKSRNTHEKRTKNEG